VRQERADRVADPAPELAAALELQRVHLVVVLTSGTPRRMHE